MKILDKAAKLEKALIDRLSRRSDITRHPIELYRAILDDIEAATEPGARGSRIFPYNAISIVVPIADAHRRATAEAVFAEAPPIETRVRTRLKHAGCADVGSLSVALSIVAHAPETMEGREYAIAFTREPSRQARPRAKATARASELQLSVATGTAAKSRYTFASTRINLGRLGDVLDRQQRVIRQNQVAFSDRDDDISQSVSRTHAHIRFDPATGDARVHDDGSTHGTRVARGGRTIDVPRAGGRGVRLQTGDEVVLGQARLRVEIRQARRRSG
jgi:hypothetical protein